MLAGRLYGIPIAGTMAHSFVQAFDDEMEAFRAFARVYPETVLLVDTYDTIEGVKKVIALARELGDGLQGARACGSIPATCSRFRRRRARCSTRRGCRRSASSRAAGSTRRRSPTLLAAGAPIDGFGVGTDLVVSADAPSLDIVYKLTEYAGEGRIKLSSGKRTLPGRKAGLPHLRRTARPRSDTIARADETLPGTPLLQPVMRGGRRLAKPASARRHPRALPGRRSRAARGASARSTRRRALPRRRSARRSSAEREVRERLTARMRGKLQENA